VKPPAHLSADAKAAWVDLVAGVQGRVVLTTVDAPLLEVAAQQLAIMRDATRRVESDGMFVPGPRDTAVQHPALAVQRDAAKALAASLKDLSLTPDTITARERRDQRRAQPR
jgi:P27 family predicted phage terminase small subunit